jgi:hypothetical protein
LAKRAGQVGPVLNVIGGLAAGHACL